MLGASQKFSKSPAAGKAAGDSRPDPEQIRRLLSSPEGQALLRLLQADGGAGLRAASEAMRRGDPEGVKAALDPLLTGTEAGTLTRSLEGKL